VNANSRKIYEDVVVEKTSSFYFVMAFDFIFRHLAICCDQLATLLTVLLQANMNMSIDALMTINLIEQF